MEINSQEKRIFSLEFIKKLKTNPDTMIISTFDSLAFGFFDAQFISRTATLNLQEVQDRLKNKRKLELDEFIISIRTVFLGISDYLLQDDPVQINCEIGLNQVNNFQFEFRSKFYNEGGRINPKKQLKKQIQMVYYLKKYEQNQGIIREIGKVCEIASQNEEQFVFDLSINNSWEQLIKRTVTQ